MLGTDLIADAAIGVSVALLLTWIDRQTARPPKRQPRAAVPNTQADTQSRECEHPSLWRKYGSTYLQCWGCSKRIRRA